LGFLCVGLLGACFFAMPFFSGTRSEIRQPPPCCQHVMLVCWLFFKFAMLFDFGCCSLAQEMNFVDHYLPYFRQQLITHPTAFPLFVYWKFMQRSAPCFFPFLQCAQSTPTPSVACSFSVLYYWVLFLRGGSQSVQGAMLVYHRGGCGNTVCCLFAHLLACISQAGLELASGSIGALLFSQCNVAWRSFVWAGGSECRSFDSFWCFFLPNVALASQQDFWFMELTLSASAL
jgi:hypothetical protein